MRERTSRRRQPRPVYFTREQLDELCERIIVGFCMERYGQELNPVPTEALVQLLEEHAHDVDQLAELPEGVNGVTEYYWDRKPVVKIDARLTQQHWRKPGGVQHSRMNARIASSTRHCGANSAPNIPATDPWLNHAGANTTTIHTTSGTTGWNGRRATCRGRS